MPHVIADRVKELSTTEGTGDIVLSGSVLGHRTFGVVLDAGDETVVVVQNDDDLSEWEVTVATYRSSPARLERGSVIASSDGGTRVFFGPGSKTVAIAPSAADVLSLRAGGDILGTLQIRGEEIDLDGAENDQFLRRIGDIWSPHTLTKANVGLELVENYQPASQLEATAGEANNRYMTPLRTAEAIAALASGGGGGGLPWALMASEELGSAAASVGWDGLPSRFAYRVVVLAEMVGASAAASGTYLGMRFNNSSSGYRNRGSFRTNRSLSPTFGNFVASSAAELFAAGADTGGGTVQRGRLEAEVIVLPAGSSVGSIARMRGLFAVLDGDEAGSTDAVGRWNAAELIDEIEIFHTDNLDFAAGSRFWVFGA